MPRFAQIFLDNLETQDVKNKPDLTIDLNFERGGNYSQQVSITNYEFVLEANKKILEKATSLSPTNAGVFEGMPLKVLVENENVFDGYLDLSNEAEFGREGSVLKAVDKKNIDWLNDIADGITFQTLFDKGFILNSDMVSVPYCLNSIPDYKEAAIMTISIYSFINQLQSAATDITMMAIEMSNPFEATSIVRITVYIEQLIIALAAMISTLLRLIDLLIQKVKYHSGCYTKTLLQRGCEYLGLNFSSTIFSTGVFEFDFTLPEKFSIPSDKDGIRGWLNQPSPNDSPFYPSGTFGDFLRAQETKFNAHIRISNGTLFLLKSGEGINSEMWNIPDYKNESFKLNTNDFKANLYIKFQTDQTEANTIDQYKGTSAQIIREPLFQTNDFRLMKGLEEVQIPFALARTKKELSIPEKIIKGFLDSFSFLMNGLIEAVNGVIEVFNQVTKIINKVIKALDVVNIKVTWQIKPIKKLKKIDLGESIENRIGMLVLQNDFFNIPKNFILIKGASAKYNKPISTNETIFSGRFFYENFYIENSFVASNERPNANQYFIFNFENIPFQKREYDLVKNNSNILFSDGARGFVNTLSWNVYNESANVEVWKNRLYTKNIQERIIEPV